VHVAVADDPLFRTDKGALLFALNFSHGTVKQPALLTLMGGPRRAGRGLAGLDGAGQAGMLKSALERMSRIRRAVLVARYAVAKLPCTCGRPCCSLQRDNPEWAEAIGVVTEWLLVQGAAGTWSHYRMRQALAQRFFGVKVSFTKIAADCKVKRDTASLYFKRTKELLNDEERLARYEYEGVLKASGVIE
jgi:hypothetical protein